MLQDLAAIEHRLIKESRLFDENWYLEKYGPQVGAGTDAVRHYIESGARQGKRPHPLFDVEWYATENPDASQSQFTPLGHYITEGACRGASPHPLFDPQWYRQQDPELERFTGNLFLHFLTTGANKGLSSHPLFDARQYLHDHPDLAVARSNPLTHFVECGAVGGCWPNRFFDVRWYQQQYWASLGSEMNPLVHFVRFGAELGHRPHPEIDLQRYRALSADAPRDALGAFVHLVTSGGTEFHEYVLSKADSAFAADLAKTVVEGVLRLVPQAERDSYTMAIAGRLRKLGGTLYTGVSPRSRAAPDFEMACERAFEKTRNGRSVHLELGTSDAWSDQRVEEYVAGHHIGDFIRLDFNLDMKPDVCASATALPFADESIDRISSNALFEHVAYPHEIIREAFRVLRPGGWLLTAAPFHFVAHDCPQDYLRYTSQFFEEVCTAAGFTEVVTDDFSCSGVYYTTHQLLKSALVMGPEWLPGGRAAQIGHLTAVALLGMMQGFDDTFHAHGRGHFHSAHALAIKPGEYQPPLRKPDRAVPFLERFPYLICPASGLPVTRSGEELVALGGLNRYRIVDGVPEMVVTHGFGSFFLQRASSKANLERWRAEQHQKEGVR